MSIHNYQTNPAIEWPLSDTCCNRWNKYDCGIYRISSPTNTVYVELLFARTLYCKCHMQKLANRLYGTRNLVYKRRTIIFNNCKIILTALKSTEIMIKCVWQINLMFLSGSITLSMMPHCRTKESIAHCTCGLKRVSVIRWFSTLY